MFVILLISGLVLQGSLLWAARWSTGKAHDTTPYSLVLLPDSTDPFHMLLLLVIASNPAVITRTLNKTVLLYSRTMLIIYEALLKLIDAFENCCYSSKRQI